MFTMFFATKRITEESDKEKCLIKKNVFLLWIVRLKWNLYGKESWRHFKVRTILTITNSIKHGFFANIYEISYMYVIGK